MVAPQVCPPRHHSRARHCGSSIWEGVNIVLCSVSPVTLFPILTCFSWHTNGSVPPLLRCACAVAKASLLDPSWSICSFVNGVWHWHLTLPSSAIQACGRNRRTGQHHWALDIHQHASPLSVSTAGEPTRRPIASTPCSCPSASKWTGPSVVIPRDGTWLRGLAWAVWPLWRSVHWRVPSWTGSGP